MLSIDSRLTLVALIPLPFVSIAVRYFGSGHPPAVRAHPGAALRPERGRAGGAVRRARRARLPPGSGRDGALRRANRGVPRAQPAADPAAGVLLPEHVVLPRPRRAARAVARQPRGDPRAASRSASSSRSTRTWSMLSWPMIAFGWVTNMLQRGMASWKRMLEVLDARAGHRRPAGRPAGDAARRCSGAIEFRNLSFAYGDRPVLDDVSVRIAAGPDGRARRADRLGQVHAHQPAAAAARPAAGHGVHRRRRRARPAARAAARRHRLRAAGAVPVLGDDRRQHRVRRAARRRGARPSGPRSRDRRWAAAASPGSTRTSPTSRRATTRWSASAASRCRAARSSGRRSRARCWSTRAS